MLISKPSVGYRKGDVKQCVGLFYSHTDGIIIKESKCMITNCDFCAYNEYDEEDKEYYCSVNMDEDDMARFIQSDYKSCPYYKSGDEYRVVRHQM